jgi:hypothetical protein
VSPSEGREIRTMLFLFSIAKLGKADPPRSGRRALPFQAGLCCFFLSLSLSVEVTSTHYDCLLFFFVFFFGVFLFLSVFWGGGPGSSCAPSFASRVLSAVVRMYGRISFYL